MNLPGTFFINNASYTKQELIDHSFRVLDSRKLDDWETDIYQFILAFLDEEVSLQQKTSGTTGDPKTVDLERNAMLQSARTTLEYFNLQPGENLLLCLPVQYIAGKMMVIRAMLGGLNIITVEPTSNPLKKLDIPIHFAAMVPLQVYQSIDKPARFMRIKKLIIGGGEIRQDLRDEIRKLKDTEIYETFAMSETCSHFGIRKINGKSPETAFSTLKGVKISTDDRSCLRVDIKGITKGAIQSNDIVEILGDNSFKWLGRIDNVINSGGKKIIPEILEARIRSIINHELMIIGIPDKKLGERHVLVVEINPREAPVEAWKESLIQTFPKHEVPKEIHCLKHFPRNKSMKVNRFEVRNIFAS